MLTLISRLAAEQGLNLYLGGGAVRDLTYGQQVVRDLDFIVEGPPQRILARHTQRRFHQIRSRRAGACRVRRPWRWNTRNLDEHLNSAELLFSNGVRAELGHVPGRNLLASRAAAGGSSRHGL